MKKAERDELTALYEKALDVTSDNRGASDFEWIRRHLALGTREQVAELLSVHIGTILVTVKGGPESESELDPMIHALKLAFVTGMAFAIAANRREVN